MYNLDTRQGTEVKPLEMGEGLRSILRCPDCAQPLDADLHCCGCGRPAATSGGYLDLLPRELAPQTRNENRVFEAGSPDQARFGGKPWRKLIGRLEIERFDKEILPALPVGAFLELAGESCWASAIYKATHPSATVVATDVSENAIARLAIPLGSMFPHAPDLYATVHAEQLPFEDASFDCVFIQSAMHHLSDPVRMLVEVRRVLKSGGRFVAVDHSVPPHFRFLFASVARARSAAFGIREDLVSFGRWRFFFGQAGFPPTCLQVYDNPAYQRNPLFALAGRLIRIFPEWAKRSLFPVGLLVVYDKP